MSKNSSQRSKYIVLFCTFIFPLLFFLFLASGKVNFKKLPILSERVLVNYPTLPFSDKVTVLSFIGENPSLESYQKVLNLYQVIYKSMAKYQKFKILTIVPNSQLNSIKKLKKELRFVGATSLEKWDFISLPSSEIQSLFESLKTPYAFDARKGISEVFIVDESLNLRGRTDDKDIESGLLYGYDAGSVSILKNKLRDDLKVIFYESKFAVKEPILIKDEE